MLILCKPVNWFFLHNARLCFHMVPIHTLDIQELKCIWCFTGIKTGFAHCYRMCSTNVFFNSFIAKIPIIKVFIYRWKVVRQKPSCYYHLVNSYPQQCRSGINVNHWYVIIIAIHIILLFTIFLAQNFE